MKTNNIKIGDVFKNPFDDEYAEVVQLGEKSVLMRRLIKIQAIGSTQKYIKGIYSEAWTHWFKVVDDNNLMWVSGIYTWKKV